MKNFIRIMFFLLLFSQTGYSQKKIWDETEEQKKERMAWWTNDRFGMFIHWGIYAQAARNEWVKKTERMTDEDYQKYVDVFNPDLFDPSEWAKKAKATGMKYAVITTKHHDGFCMFDSDYTDYDVMNTPYGEDIIKKWVEAFRAEGLGIGFYYSLIDWHHPDYTIDNTHPKSGKTQAEYDELNKNRDMGVYREYLKSQVKELLTKYGKIDIIWFDFVPQGSFGKSPEDFDAVGLLKMVRALQPGIIINERCELKDYAGGWDIITAERMQVKSWPEVDGEKVPWESCKTFSGSWCYYRDENTWKDNKQLLVTLIETVSKGGNLLLNVGPTARGTFDYRANKALDDIGEWMKYNNRSIYGCTQAPNEFITPENTLMTYNPKTKRIYIHLLDYPSQKFLLLGFGDKIKYAQFLHDASEIKIEKPREYWSQPKVGITDINLLLPLVKPNIEIPVIELFLK